MFAYRPASNEVSKIDILNSIIPQSASVGSECLPWFFRFNPTVHLILCVNRSIDFSVQWAFIIGFSSLLVVPFQISFEWKLKLFQAIKWSFEKNLQQRDLLLNIYSFFASKFIEFWRPIELLLEM